MKTFTVRTQATGGYGIRSPKPSKWAEIKNEDIRIVFDGTHRTEVIGIRVEANGIVYHLNDMILEVILGRMAEDLANEFLEFAVYQK